MFLSVLQAEGRGMYSALQGQSLLLPPNLIHPPPPSPHTHLSVSKSAPRSSSVTPAGFGQPSKNMRGSCEEAAAAAAAAAAADPGGALTGGTACCTACCCCCSTRNSRQKPMEFCWRASIDGTTYIGGRSKG